MMCPVKEEDTAWKLPPEAIRFTGRAGMPDIANCLPVSHWETCKTRNVCLYWATVRSQTYDYICPDVDWHGHTLRVLMWFQDKHQESEQLQWLAPSSNAAAKVVTKRVAEEYFIGSTCISCYCSVTQSCPTLRPHELQPARFPCPSLSPRVCSNSSPLSWWRHPAISSSAIPFSSCPQSLPASGSFPMSQLFVSGGQNH